MFIFFIPVFDFSHACKPYKSHLALFIISNKSSARSFFASNDYFSHRTTISYRNAEALYLKLFEIQCFPAFSISSCWYHYFMNPPHNPSDNTSILSFFQKNILMFHIANCIFFSLFFPLKWKVPCTGHSEPYHSSPDRRSNPFVPILWFHRAGCSFLRSHAISAFFV